MTDQYSPPPAGLHAGASVWVYLRDSGGPSQDQSVGQQEDEIKAYCKKYNLEILQTFTDAARSGGSTIGRDEFQAMMEMSESESMRPSGLLIWNFARFARDYNDSVYYKATLHKRGILVHSLTDQIPADDFAGRIVETVINLANEEKLRQTSRDVKRGLKALVSKGFSPGNPPRGYIAVKVDIGEKRDGSRRIVSKWVPDPILSEYVKIAFQLRAEGKSYAEIEKATNGKMYSCATSWRTFFSNQSYLGYFGRGSNAVRDHHEPLINYEVFEAVQKQMKRSLIHGEGGGLYHPRRVGSPSLLSGFTYCIECNTLVASGYGSKKHPWAFYLCGKKNRHGYSTCVSKRIGAKNAEEQIINTVLNHVLTPEYLSEVISETKKKIVSTDELERQKNAARRKLEDLDIIIQRTLNAIEKTGSEAAQARLKQREAEKVQVKNEIERLSAQLATAQIEFTPEAMEVILQAWRDQFAQLQESGNVQKIKAWLMLFVSRIELGYNKARIFYTYPMIDFFSSPLQGNGASLRGGTSLILGFTISTVRGC